MPFTPEEEAARDIEEAAYRAGKTDRLWEMLRGQRNGRLAETDWWIARGNPTDDELAYRQALRDLPENTADPDNPNWPEKP